MSGVPRVGPYPLTHFQPVQYILDVPSREPPLHMSPCMPEAYTLLQYEQSHSSICCSAYTRALMAMAFVTLGVILVPAQVEQGHFSQQLLCLCKDMRAIVHVCSHMQIVDESQEHPCPKKLF